ncbi:MAG: type II toxin-antitoxin system VapC family toxin [Bacteroidetes bacterium]|nr:type II toxin-antitoxin system VapC family toxin [Bacteroidota bacterium]
MVEALIDTDILSYYFKGDTNVVRRFTRYLEQFDIVNISIISYFEILSGLKFKQADKQIQQFEDFVSSNNILLLSEESARIASDIYSDLRHRGITIGSSDIFIAAVAIENGLQLITNNEKHFEVIKGLNLENWKR